MVKVFVPAPLPSVSYIPLLYPQWGIQVHKNELYLDSAFQFFTENFVEIVDDIANADAIVVPHFYTLIVRKNLEYLNQVHAFSLAHTKPLILFAYGDSAEEISLTNTIVFRYSQYRANLQPNEIIMPPVAPDIGTEVGVVMHKKSKDTPIVGFCGWADYKNFGDSFRAFLKNTYFETLALITRAPLMRARKKGIYFRKKALALLENSPLVRTQFIVRNSHSLNKNLISLDPVVARKEFIENIRTSDLNLTTKGDGNAATRFYEILSLGHIPLVIDTDTTLPLEHIIPYKEFVVSVPLQELNSAPRVARDWFLNISDEEYAKRQKMAREYYLKYLRMDSFLKHIFSSKEVLMGGVTFKK